MLPKPSLVLVSAVLLTSLAGTAMALGLGGMRTQSALNQPFYAEIELNDVNPEELDAVRVQLASLDEFTKAGAERPHFLTRLQFTPTLGSDGRPHIQVTSREAIREPYIDFLVEVIWPEGRLVKEYTVLLDPPARGMAAAAQVTEPPMAAPRRRPPPALEPAPAPALRHADAAQASAQQLPQAAPARVPPEAQATRFPLYYGPVPRGATLLGIARELTPPGASVEQTAMALFRSNQDAFIRSRVSLLRAGADLVVPTAEELFALDQAAARRQFQDALAGRRVNTSPITAVPSDARLRIAASAGPSLPPATADTALHQELLSVQADAESNRQEATELRNRIGELEQQLLDIRRLLELRDEQLAQLQHSARAGDAAAPGALPLARPPVETSSPSPATPALGLPAPAPAPAPTSATAKATTEPAVEAVDFAVPDSADTVQATLLVPTTADADASAGASAWAGTLKALRSARAPAAPWVLAGGAGVVLIGGLGLLALRRRQRAEPVADGPMGEDAVAVAHWAPPSPGGPGTDGGSAAIALGEDNAASVIGPGSAAPRQSASAGAGAGSVSGVQMGLPTAPASNSPEAQDAIQEADAIAEADIFILYGRYREAEALLRDELEQASERVELKYKLGEALLGGAQGAALAELLAAMRAAGDDAWDTAQWASLEAGLAGLGAGEAMAGLELELEPLDAAPSLDEEPSFVAEDAPPEAQPSAVPTRSAPSTAVLQIASQTSVDTQTQAQAQTQDTLPAPERQPAQEQAQAPPSELAHAAELELVPRDPLMERVPDDACASDSEADADLWDEAAIQLDLARAYIAMEDLDAARAILEPLAEEGGAQQRADARSILASIGSA